MESTIDVLEKFKLGLVRDGTVVLHPHNRSWSNAAMYEIERLKSKIGGSGFSFHHIGSTSIPGICAKPILDVLLMAPTLEAIDSFKEAFEDLGYEYKGEYGIPGRRYCVLYNEEKSKGYVHLHAFIAGSVDANNHLLFRDYLRANPNVAGEYQELKFQLLANQELNRSQYTESKAAFIRQVLREAHEWKSK